jgi:hypothetical protein
VFLAWENTLPFMAPTQGFGAVRRIVTKRCLKWARVVTKYKQVYSGDPDAPVVKKIPVEWGFRCLKWAPYLAYAPTRRPGTREEYVPVQTRKFRRFGKAKKIYREGGNGVLGFLSSLFGNGLGSYNYCKRGGKLSSARRRTLPRTVFGLPEQRKYPMPDVSHARNAKARASMMYRRGALSRQQYSRITRKADRIIRLCAGRSGRSFRTTRGFPKRIVRERGMLTRRCVRYGISRIGRRTCREYRWSKTR